MTEQEQERMRVIQNAIGTVGGQLKEQMGEGALGEGGIELVLGSMMAAVDAVFAIRDGETWRGLNDPQEIARKLLRDAKLGE